MRLKNISDFVHSLSQIQEHNSNLNQLLFRGHSKESYELKSNLYRREKFYVNEDNIFKETIMKSPHEFHNCKSTIEILVKMQHYGVPTRLLDVTRNPLVALFFACNGNYDDDGELIALNVPINSVLRQ